MKHALRTPFVVKLAFARALRHDCLNLSQSAAYSAIVALFPALIVLAAMIALLPGLASLKIEVGEFFDEVLPSNVFPLLNSYFVSSPGSTTHTTRAVVLAAVVSFIGASSVIATLMEGLRRAVDLPMSCWTFWQRRMRAFALVPLSLAPLLVATVLVMFGRWMTEWVAGNLWNTVRPAFFGIALAVRWIVSLSGVAGLTALIYHVGTPKRQHWARVLPGAVVATGLWFMATLGFGWYVTRVANYSLVYGSLGAGIALLIWLYLIFLSMLVGAEFNAELSSAEEGESRF